MTRTETRWTIDERPAYDLECRHCAWRATNVPKTLAARVIVEHMEHEHGARS